MALWSTLREVLAVHNETVACPCCDREHFMLDVCIKVEGTNTFGNTVGSVIDLQCTALPLTKDGDDLPWCALGVAIVMASHEVPRHVLIDVHGREGDVGDALRPLHQARLEELALGATLRGLIRIDRWAEAEVQALAVS